MNECTGLSEFLWGILFTHVKTACKKFMCATRTTWKGAHWYGYCPSTCTLIKNLMLMIIWVRLSVFHHFYERAHNLGQTGVFKQLKSRSGPGCSKLTMLLVNVSLKFQTLISQTCQYFFGWKKCEKLLQCKSFSHFFNKKYHCIWLLSC